ncbi:MAG TPA: hypothetical protein VF631_04345 [Allosphingosinicella sp.]|jgi:hypothetical protein|uniref:hypothetical protein n=1 Tax=Allosphingosinicella sp. TaxID=2823234 RepID=UPI002F28E7E3
MNQITKPAVDTSKILGWGVDADPENDPTFPMRDRSEEDRTGPGWQSPPPQQVDVEILQSVEYERRPAVVGTSTPPSGLSGVIRRTAFRFSESDWTHWLMLMGADRINVVEGVLQDLGRFKVPNIPAEMGVRSELRHNKEGFAKKVAVAAVAGALIYGLVRARKRPSGDQAGSADQGRATELPEQPSLPDAP